MGRVGPYWNWRHVEFLLVAGSVVAGVVLRFVADSPTWLDEALSIEIASRDLGSIDDLLRRDGHPPLYYWLLHWWMKIFGTTDFAARSMSGVIGLGAWAAVVVLAHRRGGNRAARSAAVVMGLLPFALRYSSEARMYSLVSLEVALGWLAIDAAWKRPTVARLIPVVLLTGALVLTHYWALYLLAVIGVVVLWHARRDGTRTAGARRVAAGLVIGGLAFVPWLPAFLHQAEHTGTPWADTARPTQVLAESVGGLAGASAPEGLLLAFIFAGLLAVAIGSGGRWARHAGAVSLATMVVGSVAGLAASSAFQSRYAAVIVPPTVLALVAGVEGLRGQATRVIALGTIAGLSVGATLVELRHDRSQSGALAAVLEAEGVPSDVIVVCPDQLGPALQRQLDDSGLLAISYPRLEPAALVDWVDYAERNAAADPNEVAARISERAVPGSSVWVIWNDSYRTLDGQCSGLIDALARTLAVPTTRLAADPGRYFEHGNLVQFVVAGA